MIGKRLVKLQQKAGRNWQQVLTVTLWCGDGFVSFFHLPSDQKDITFTRRSNSLSQMEGVDVIKSLEGIKRYKLRTDFYWETR